MSSNEYGVLILGLRRAVRHTVLDALDRSPALRLADAAADADVVLIDACSLDREDPVAELNALPGGRHLRRIVLSLPHTTEAPAGSFAAEIATREAAAVAGPAESCVLRCAPFGQELGWSCRYETAGALYTAWQPEGAPWVDVMDMIELVERLLTGPGQWGSAFDLTGPAVVSMHQACKELRALHDRSLLYVPLDEQMQRSAMERAGFDAAFAMRLVGYMLWATSPRCREISPVLEQALGRPPKALSDYLVDSARASLALAR